MSRPINLALVQFKPKKGDYRHNVARLSQIFATIATMTPRPDILTFPETAFSGYFLEGGVRDVACSAEAIADVLYEAYQKSAVADHPIDVVAGFYEVHNNMYYNSAVYVAMSAGRREIVHVHRKVFLPTYGLFDEERFVEHGLEIRAFDTRWGRAAILVCEDAWHSITATAAALDGAQIIFVPSASPARGAWPQPDEQLEEAEISGDISASAPASLHRWQRLARDRSEEHGVYVAVTQLVGNEGGKAFAGGSIVTGPSGDVRLRAPLWEEAILPVQIDLDDITRARADSPLLADLRLLLPHLIRSLRRTVIDDERS